MGFFFCLAGDSLVTVLGRVTSDEIKATALTGTLRMTKHGPMEQPVKTATLQDATGRDILPPLRCAKVVTVDRGSSWSTAMSATLSYRKKGLPANVVVHPSGACS